MGPGPSHFRFMNQPENYCREIQNFKENIDSQKGTFKLYKLRLCILTIKNPPRYKPKVTVSVDLGVLFNGLNT